MKAPTYEPLNSTEGSTGDVPMQTMHIETGPSDSNSALGSRFPAFIRVIACVAVVPLAMMAVFGTFASMMLVMVSDDPSASTLAVLLVIAFYLALLAGLYSLVWCLGSISFTGQPPLWISSSILSP